MELRQANQQRPNFAHVDIKSAFDSVDRQALWKAIRDFGTPPFRCTATLMPVFDSPQRQECVRDVSYPYTRLRRNRLVCYVTRPLVRESPSLDASFSDLTYAESQMTPSCSQDRRRCSHADVLDTFDITVATFRMHVSWTKTRFQSIGAGVFIS